MKVYLIKASAKGAFKDYKKYMGSPPQNIFSAAACTPSDVNIEMTDETVDMKVHFKSDADLIAVFMSTPDAPRAYDIARKFREKGKTVVFGGLHASFLPEEALLHGDAVMIGESEGIWEQLLEDHKNGSLKTRYQRETPVDLASLKAYPTGIISKDWYGGFWTVVVGRGCPNACTYCAVSPFFKSHRYRPVDDVVREVMDCGADRIELHADNLTADRKYALELFRKLKPLGIRWSGETTIDIADDEELLRAAAESGLEFLLVGLETPSGEALDGAGKGFVNLEKVKGQIDRLHKHGIAVDSAFLFGFDQHTQQIFEDTYRFAKETGVDSMHSVILIPFPGTPLYKKMEAEGRIITRDWSKYDGAHAVYHPEGMTAPQLENGAWWFYKKTLKMGKNFVASGEDPTNYSGEKLSVSEKKPIPWKALLELGMILTVAIANSMLLWGILFLVWSLSAVWAGYTGLLTHVSRRENPIIFWLMTATWVVLSMIYIFPNYFWFLW